MNKDALLAVTALSMMAYVIQKAWTPSLVLLYLMMVSSNSKFGGPRPMISKGKIEEDEDALSCVLCKAEEEKTT